MKSYPPEIESRIRRLRRTAALIWIVWLILAIPLYWAYRIMPDLVATPLMVTASASVLGIGAIWFTYVIYRIGEVAGED